MADRHEKPKTARETRCAVQLFARPLAVSYSFSYLRKRISQSSWIDYNLPGLQFHALYTIGLQSSKWAKGHVSLLPGLVLLVSSVRSSYSHPDLLLTQQHPLFQITPVLNNNIGLSLSEPLQLYQ